jgi:hypothetical protein
MARVEVRWLGRRRVLWALLTDGTYATYGTNGSVHISPMSPISLIGERSPASTASPGALLVAQNLAQMIQTNLRPTLKQLSISL